MADANTENKRRSATNYPGTMVNPKPDTTIDAYDRKQATGYYRGPVLEEDWGVSWAGTGSWIYYWWRWIR